MTDPRVTLRPLAPEEDTSIEWVAQRMRGCGLTRAATKQGAHHQPLQRWFEDHGYAITLRAGEMVRLTRDLG